MKTIDQSEIISQESGSFKYFQYQLNSLPNSLMVRDILPI